MARTCRTNFDWFLMDEIDKEFDGGYRQILTAKLDELVELRLFSGICSRSIYAAVRSVETLQLHQDIVRQLGDVEKLLPTEKLQQEKERAREEAEFARAQSEAGSPYLYALCSVRLWTLLEALVDELVAHSLKYPDRCQDQGTLDKLKGKLIEFLSASKDDQAATLCDQLKQITETSKKLGVGRFEAILAPIGLGGATNEDVRLALLELSQLRNLIVHKGGRADRKFLEACPWFAATRGEPVLVSASMFDKFLFASHWYLVELMGRVEERKTGARARVLTDGQDVFLSALRSAGHQP